MSVSEELLGLVRQVLGESDVHRPDLVQRLRGAFPGIAFSVCDDNDVPSRLKPLAEGAGFALYGINTGGHCASLGSCLESASGLAIALRDEHV